MARATESTRQPRPRGAPAVDPVAAGARRDPRRWIYAGLDVVFAAVQALLIWKVAPNRLPSASLHLWTLPIATLALSAGTLLGGRTGWWVAIVAASSVLLSTVLMIMRILVSAAFLAGVYGAFGTAASMIALLAVAVLVELVALLPIVQLRYLLARAGRRALGAS